MLQPTSRLLGFIKAHATPGVTSYEAAKSSSQNALAHAATLVVAADNQSLSDHAVLAKADEAVRCCVAGIVYAHGFKVPEAALADADALEVLGAELELSEDSLTPLREVRTRAQLPQHFAAGGLPTSFLAHQARFLTKALVEWSNEHAKMALAV
jgi:precorrin-2 methylase